METLTLMVVVLDSLRPSKAVLPDCSFIMGMAGAVGDSGSSVVMLLLGMVAVIVASDKRNTNHIVL